MKTTTLAKLIPLCCFAGISFQSLLPARETQDIDELGDAVYTLEAFVVQSGTEDTMVRAQNTLGALRTATELVESPITVSVLKPELIESFQLYDPDEAGPFVASWLSGEVEAGGGGGSRLRGFEPLPFRNGFERTGVGTVVNLDRIEIIKGPLSAMFGRSNPGGLINYVTRLPMKSPSYQFKGTYGTYDYTRLEAHLTGPVSENLFYRVDTLYNYNEGIQDFFYTRTSALSTSWHYKFSDKTSLFVEVEQLNRTQDRGTDGILNRYNSLTNSETGQTVSNVIGGINTQLVKNGFNQHGPDAKVSREITTVDIRLEHAFDCGLKMRANFQWWDREFDDYRWTTPQYYVEDGVFKGREPFRHYQPEDAISGQINFLYDSKMGNFAQNQLLVAFDYTKSNFHREDWRMGLSDRDQQFPSSGPVRNLDPLSPVYGEYSHEQLTRETRLQLEERSRSGILISDRIGFLDGNLLAYGSLRYQDFENAAGQLSRTAGNGVQDLAEYEGFSAEDGGKSADDVWTYSAGVVGKLLGDSLTVFANHSTSFEWTSTLDNGTGELQENIEGVGYEAGFRGETFLDKVYWTATVFQITRENIPQSNPEYVSDPETGEVPVGIPQYVGSASERSEGYEFEIVGDPTENLSFTFALGYVDAYTKDSPDDVTIEGRKLLRAPEWNVGATVTYRIKDGFLKGLTTGVAYRYTDDYYARFGEFGSEVTGTDVIKPTHEQPGGGINRIEEIRPSYDLVDWYASYGWEAAGINHSLRLSIKNLFDKEWWTVTGRLGSEREYRVSYSMRF